MTYQVKEGDVLEYRGDGEWVSYHTLTVGKRYTIKRDALGLYIATDAGLHAVAAANFPEQYGFHLVSTAPPETIQHEGYNYTRGEPVVPEWVKDGAWVVGENSGVVARLRVAAQGFNVEYLSGVSYNFPASDVYIRFRPFTNEDWKWGMWAEYQGEKVFVTKVYTVGAVISTPKEEHLVVLFSEITPTTAP